MERKYFIDYKKKHILEDGSIEYLGYIFHKEGFITGPKGKKVTITKKTGSMRFKIEEGKVIVVKAGRLVYELIHETEVNRSSIINHKDGDLSNVAFDNLEYVERKDYFKDHNWTCKFSEELAKQIYEEYQKGDTSIQKLSDKYDCCNTTTWRIVQGNYLGTKKQRKRKNDK